MSYQTYTVKRGDNLSKIARELGVKGGWQALYNYNKGVIGKNPNLIFAGQTYNLPGTKKAAPAKAAPPPPAFDPVQQVLAPIKKEIPPPRQSFEDRYGTVEQMTPTAALHQFAEQQVNPEALRRASQVMKNLDWQRAIQGSGAQMSGYGQLERGNTLNELERQRAGDVKAYMGDQQDRFRNWYESQRQSYGSSTDPNWVLNRSAGNFMGGQDWSKIPTQRNYDTYSLDKYFTGGYGATPNWGGLYNQIT